MTRAIRARLEAAGAPKDISPADDARAIVEMLQAARTLGPGGRPGEGGKGGGGKQERLVPGSHPTAFPVLQQWSAAESREEAVMAMANESSQTTYNHGAFTAPVLCRSTSCCPIACNKQPVSVLRVWR